MLSPEQAEATLKSHKVKDFVKRRSALCDALPTALRGTGRGLTRRDENGKELRDWQKRSTAYDQAAKHLDALSSSQRKGLLAALFPQLEEHVESAWQLMKSTPYQGYGSRKPFRAPHSPEASLSSRGAWLNGLLHVTEGYDQPITWYAEWAGHIESWGNSLGVLLAAAIEQGGPIGNQVFDTLVAGASGQHDIAQMGRHVVRALLLSSREDGWQFIERMLLAAQRQEGLRQSILESVDESHPGAFRRLIQVILDQNLARFAATVRAVDVWFGLMWDSASTGVVKDLLTQVAAFFDSPQEIEKALAADKAESAYLALWTIAFTDADAAIAPATRLLKHKDPALRFAGAILLQRLDRHEALHPLVPVLADADVRVAAVAASALAGGSYTEREPESDLFERFEQLLDRFPKQKTKQKPLLWPWYEMEIHRQSIARALLDNLGKRPVDRLLPYVRDMEPYARSSVIHRIGADDDGSVAAREFLFAMVGDPSGYVRSAALEIIGKCKVTPDEAQQLERMLTRKPGDLRRGLLAVLLGQSDERALASAERLLAAGDSLQRQAGLELLLRLVEAGRKAEQCRQQADRFVARGLKLPDEEQRLAKAVLDTGRKVATLDDALGLMDPAARASIPPVQKRSVLFVTPAAVNILYSLDNLTHVHRETPVEITLWNNEKQERLLGQLGWSFPTPNTNKPLAEELMRLPCRELWEQWLANRDTDLRDNDGLELERAKAILHISACESRGLNKEARKLLSPPDLRKLRYRDSFGDLLSWLIWMSTPTSPDALLDLAETAYALVPEKELRRVQDPTKWREFTWRGDESAYLTWTKMAEAHLTRVPHAWTAQNSARLWQLERWKDEPTMERDGTLEHIKVLRIRPELTLLVAAYGAGMATDADIYDQLLGTRPREEYYYQSFDELATLTAREPSDLLKAHPWLQQFGDRCRQRVLEVELERGDTPTAASSAALSIASVWGVSDLVRIIAAIGKDALHRGWSRDSKSKSTVLSHLLRISRPLPEDNVASLAAALEQARVSQQRMLEVAVYSPQWARLIEGVLQWKGLEDAIWWVHAHTKDNRWSVDQDIREAWQNEIAQRTPLETADLVDGAVDVAWFNKVYAQLGKARWQLLDEAAKYASGGAGHARAQLFADAMLGQAKKTELVQRITKKRYQDAVRALGLLPLAKADAREKDLLGRYKQLQEFIRTSRQYGSQRQASEKRAALIGQANLARTAGYQDPLRMQWAMEARAVADLADGPISVKVKETTVALAIDDQGDVDLTVTKNGVPLKAIPAAAKNHKEVKALQERRKEIKRQASRIRPVLEQMMCRGDTVSSEELCELMQHPLISPLLKRLVLYSDDLLGYPEAGGKKLRDAGGTSRAVKKRTDVRIAHPHDLRQSGQWSSWQQDCFQREMVQPFKQVFRELYPLTEAEQKEKTQSRRYAGQQVNPSQAMALFGTRQWTTVAYEGVRKTFHELDLSAYVTFQEGFYTPAEIDGLTLEAVKFTRRGDWDLIPLTDIPPRIFSEVMRDLDLVVSVAHRGGVDPEATASTVEMRSNLLRETLALVGIDNVRIEKNHALVDGQLANYTVHLGSAVTHKLPGGAMFLIPVHSQHRGRMFLPFADDDPKTAEVLSKVMLLARDTEIKDPNILDQIRRV